MTADARQQLVAIRSRLVGNLGQRIEGGDLALLAAVNGALSAVEAVDAVLPDAGQAARAVVSDVPGEPILRCCCTGRAKQLLRSRCRRSGLWRWRAS
jgi:hypothetical protein